MYYINCDERVTLINRTFETNLIDTSIYNDGVDKIGEGGNHWKYEGKPEVVHKEDGVSVGLILI